MFLFLLCDVVFFFISSFIAFISSSIYSFIMKFYNCFCSQFICLLFLLHDVNFLSSSVGFIHRVGTETQKKINNLTNGSFNSRRSRGGSEITKFRPCDQDDGALDRLRRDKTQTSGAVTLRCLSVWVCLCDCVDLHQVEAAELQTSLSVKIKVKNTSTIKTGCSYLMSWKPWEPSLGGFVVVRQFQWQVLVPT